MSFPDQNRTPTTWRDGTHVPTATASTLEMADSWRRQEAGFSPAADCEAHDMSSSFADVRQPTEQTSAAALQAAAQWPNSNWRSVTAADSAGRTALRSLHCARRWKNGERRKRTSGQLTRRKKEKCIEEHEHLKSCQDNHIREVWGWWKRQINNQCNMSGVATCQSGAKKCSADRDLRLNVLGQHAIAHNHQQHWHLYASSYRLCSFNRTPVLWKHVCELEWNLTKQ